jgi:pimeloyl-ACP methyl ester carboxylesterase
MPISFFWNKDLIVFAHGYVSPLEPIGIPENQLNLNGIDVPNAINALGYAFAVTGYSKNGLAVKQGVSDVIDLINIFKAAHPDTRRVYVVGVSEGALITTLAAEQPNAASVFNGALALCGPIGDFRAQVEYFADFRVAFDYFFPGLLGGSAISIPQTLLLNWNSTFTNTVLPQIISPAAALSMTQLFSVTGVPIDLAQPITSMISATYNLLWYNVHSTNDGIAELGGNPYGNVTKVYSGTLNDPAFNAGVARFSADAAALVEIDANYQTRGVPKLPIVTSHTVGDDTVPYFHVPRYAAKVAANGLQPRYDHIASNGYGHCNFSTAEIQAALTLLQQRVNNPPRFRSLTPLVLK